MALATEGIWPAWAGSGMGFRRTRLLTYAMVAASCLLALYVFTSWERMPSLEELKSQYYEYKYV